MRDDDIVNDYNEFWNKHYIKDLKAKEEALKRLNEFEQVFTEIWFDDRYDSVDKFYLAKRFVNDVEKSIESLRELEVSILIDDRLRRKK